MKKVQLLLPIFILCLFTSLVSAQSSETEKPGYILIRFDQPAKENVAKFRAYGKQAGMAGKQHGVEVLSPGQVPIILEGDKESAYKYVLLKFPTVSAAKQMYHSEAYSKAKQIRKGIVNFEMLLLQGQ